MVKRLDDLANLATRCREQGFGFAEFRRHDSVIDLDWPDDPLEQWIYDHSSNGSFLRDYGQSTCRQLSGRSKRSRPQTS
jgi:hypothetical protein